MKKNIFLFMLIGFSISSFSQKPTTKQDFQTRSKNQKTAAWVLLGGGVGLGLIGWLLAIVMNQVLMKLAPV